jgi:lysophospholipase L1-like esterase
MRTQPLPRWVGHAIALLLSLSLSLCAIEGFLRHHFYGSMASPDYSAGFVMPDESIGWRLRPNAVSHHQELDFVVPVTINSKGLRERERPYEKGPGVFRILLVSDSATFASGVTLEQSLPSLLAEGLGSGVEVVNFAVPAYSNVQELLLFRDEGAKYRPDLVLLAISPINDIQTNFEPLQTLYQKSLRRPYARLETGQLRIDFEHADVFRSEHDEAPGGIKGLIANNVTPRLFKHVRKKLFPGRKPDPNVFLGWPFLASFAPEFGAAGLSAADYAKLWDEGWQTTQALILALRGDAEAAGARFSLFASPAKIQGDERYRARIVAAFPGLQLDVHGINRELVSFGERNGIPVLDALSAIEQAAASHGDPLYFDIEDEHLTARAHAVIARALVAQLGEEGLVPVVR